MRQFIRISVIAAIAFVAVLAQGRMTEAQTAEITEKFFTNAPAQAMPLLSKNARLDMLDYYRNGLSTPTVNELKGRSRITGMSPHSIDVQISDSTALQFVLVEPSRFLPDYYIMVVETVNTPVPDSSIRAFDTDWNEMPVELPGYTSFIPKDKRKLTKTMDEPPLTFTEIRFDPEKKTFVFRDRSKEGYYKGDTPEILAYFLPEIELRPRIVSGDKKSSNLSDNSKYGRIVFR